MSPTEASPQVTRGQIADALRELGLAPGDSVFVHSPLSRFGRVEGGGGEGEGPRERGVKEDARGPLVRRGRELTW